MRPRQHMSTMCSKNRQLPLMPPSDRRNRRRHVENINVRMCHDPFYNTSWTNEWYCSSADSATVLCLAFAVSILLNLVARAHRMKPKAVIKHLTVAATMVALAPFGMFLVLFMLITGCICGLSPAFMHSGEANEEGAAITILVSNPAQPPVHAADIEGTAPGAPSAPPWPL